MEKIYTKKNIRFLHNTMIVNWAGIIAASHWVPYTCVVADPKPQRHQEEYQNAEVNQGLQ